VRLVSEVNVRLASGFSLTLPVTRSASSSVTMAQAEPHPHMPLRVRFRSRSGTDDGAENENRLLKWAEFELLEERLG
jgi:hypothetical protein